MNISIVIPAKDEQESIPELSQWISRVMETHGFSYEVIFVDDGSTDLTWNEIQKVSAVNPFFKGIKFNRNFGKSAALHTAFKLTQGNVVITMDADLQDSPDEIPGLYKMITEDGFQLVSGWKKKRHDPISKTVPSKFFNFVTRKISGINLHDFNCGLKAYHYAVVKNISVYGEMHRYIPVIAKWAGFKKIGEKVVAHRARKFGKSRFGMRRFVNGFLDLLSISFVGKFSKRPMHFFGLWGSLFFLIGLGISVYLIVSKIIDSSFPITNRPGFYLALTSIVIGMQLFLAGFIGELISRNSPSRNSYLIEKKTGL